MKEGGYDFGVMDRREGDGVLVLELVIVIAHVGD